MEGRKRKKNRKKKCKLIFCKLRGEEELKRGERNGGKNKIFHVQGRCPMMNVIIMYIKSIPNIDF